ncbi:hypothetical protein K504DRAFT_494427 [Pleomassaria siparia CBS 279.74]|uniref:Uncharacterized protein n=1 Tax=Pleomassaria siparia CBS 279.74 TaxID=1314801 RepID=A0A6G1JX54_9PLEO|nr:hypothetical protein K504DRAFT_494427 [Pleomassaria siparia CBS 279.74]
MTRVAICLTKVVSNGFLVYTQSGHFTSLMESIFMVYLGPFLHLLGFSNDARLDLLPTNYNRQYMSSLGSSNIALDQQAPQTWTEIIDELKKIIEEACLLWRYKFVTQLLSRICTSSTCTNKRPNEYLGNIGHVNGRWLQPHSYYYGKGKSVDYISARDQTITSLSEAENDGSSTTTILGSKTMTTLPCSRLKSTSIGRLHQRGVALYVKAVENMMRTECEFQDATKEYRIPNYFEATKERVEGLGPQVAFILKGSAYTPDTGQTFS